LKKISKIAKTRFLQFFEIFPVFWDFSWVFEVLVGFSCS